MKKIRPYILGAVAFVIVLSAGTGRGSIVEGNRCGDFAPRVALPGMEEFFSFQNDSGSYTLLHFWAAYDAKSRFDNIQLAQAVEGISPQVKMFSVSFDESEAVFVETVKADRLAVETQYHEPRGKKSPFYKKYALKRGFRNFLIDDKGVIVAENVTVAEVLGFRF